MPRPLFQFDPRRVPFSAPGSFLAIAEPPPQAQREGPDKGAALPGGLYLRTVRGASPTMELLHLAPTACGGEAKVSATPAALRMECADGASVEICFDGPQRLRVRCRGTGLRLSRLDWRPFDHVIPRGDGTWVINSYLNRTFLGLRALLGRVEMDAPWERVRCTSLRADLLPSAEDGAGEFVVEAFQHVWPPAGETRSFDACTSAQRESWEQWISNFPAGLPDVLQSTLELSYYLQWSCLVEPSGHFARPAMLMSKYKMRNVWSWDHCFNAMALAGREPDLAWDQFLLPFDLASPEGGLPCSFNDHSVFWHSVKPPVHGWTLDRMLSKTDLPPALLEPVYQKLCAWTEWWFAHHDRDGDGLPEADHGNDTGWDNASVFDRSLPVITPDLPALLVLQMHTCAGLAARLGLTPAAQAWRDRAGLLLARLRERLWDDAHGQYVSRCMIGGEAAPGDCLINFIPLALGEHLPPDDARRMVEGLLRPGRFLTAHGLASEALDSPFYSAEGYWRGPVWAPAVYLIIDGLARAGYRPEAADLAGRFIRTAARSGLPENYQATSGEPLRDPTYTWTASVLQLVVEEYPEAWHTPANVVG